MALEASETVYSLWSMKGCRDVMAVCLSDVYIFFGLQAYSGITSADYRSEGQQKQTH